MGNERIEKFIDYWKPAQGEIDDLMDCSCGAGAQVVLSTGMLGQRGWRVLAACGSDLFHENRTRVVASWNAGGRGLCHRLTKESR